MYRYKSKNSLENITMIESVLIRNDIYFAKFVYTNIVNAGTIFQMNIKFWLNQNFVFLKRVVIVSSQIYHKY